MIIGVSGVFGQVPKGQLLSHWKDTTLVASTAHDNTYNEIWGVAVNGREYAIIGSTYGTHFIDVTDPMNISEVLRVPGAFQGPGVIHRDYHDHQGYLYAVCDEGSTSTLQIMDIRSLPDSVQMIYDKSDLIRRTHNIFIDSTSSLMYACYSAGTALSFAALRVFDISEPGEPKLVQTYNEINGVGLSSAFGVHDAFARNDTVFLNNGFGGMVMADFSKPDSAVLIGNIAGGDYPFSGYNHSGWMTEDGRYYYFADEDHGYPMKIVDLTKLPDLRIVDVFDAASTSSASIPHNQVIAGDYLYVAYYFDGLQVYDISDPEAPVRVMHYPTSSRPHASGKYQGAWGVYPFLPSGNILVSDMQEGLYVIAPATLVSNNDVAIVPQWSVYPNPASDVIMIDVDNEVISATLCDISGNLVKSVKGQNQIDIVGLPSGIYFLTVDDGHYIYQSKVAVQSK